MINIDQLKSKWIGKRSDFDKQFGYQCVDWAKQAALDLYDFQLGSFAGGALSGWNIGSPFDRNWKRVKNTANAIPPAGAVVFFDKTASNPYGHVAITDIGCTGKVLNVIEQNAGNINGDGKGSNAIRKHTYDYITPKCLGWFIKI